MIGVDISYFRAFETFVKRPFFPNFCACPVECEAYSSGVVKIFAFLEFEPWLNKKADLTGQAKISIFQRSRIRSELICAVFLG